MPTRSHGLMRVFWAEDAPRDRIPGVLVGWRNSDADVLVVGVLQGVDARNVEHALRMRTLFRGSPHSIDKLTAHCGGQQLQVLGTLNAETPPTTFDPKLLSLHTVPRTSIPSVDCPPDTQINIQIITFARPDPKRMQYLSLTPISLALGDKQARVDEDEERERKRKERLVEKLKEHTVVRHERTEKELALYHIVTQINCSAELNSLMQQNIGMVGVRTKRTMSVSERVVESANNLWDFILLWSKQAFWLHIWPFASKAFVLYLMMLRIAAEGILLLLAWKPTGRAALRDISATAQQVNIRLQYPDMPLVKATKGKMTMVPMELLMVKENQRYNYKMDEKQTANMIKFAVTAPPERWAHIEHGQKMLDWSGDPVLQKYGMKVNPKRTIVPGRLLPAPIVKYSKGEAKPGTSGRWDLKAKVFLQSNPVPLKSWAVCVISGRRGGKPDKSVIDKFVSEFVKGYIGLGGKVENKNPPMVLAAGDDAGAWVTDTWNKAGNTSQMRPQMLMFILPDKDTQTYGRIKRSAECRYGVVSQCVQYAHAQKAQLQYIANVCMKFNAKLGGATCRAIGKTTSGPNGIFTSPTMIIGADVSHSAPGVEAPSMAALTMSVDKLATRYAATCQSNGYRVEMVNSDIINNELKLMVQHWMQAVGQGKLPAVVFYLRDGVSEGQYAHVLQQEVADMKALFKRADPNNATKFVCVVGSKRHHIRLFPEKGDKNGNALPGTLIESGVTNPFENDFFLCGHNALKGTARPVHYYVLLNETTLSNDYIHTLLYEHAYQYARATTPVSIHPAIYYAHLAAARAVFHDPKWSGSSDLPQGTTNKQSGSQGQSGNSSSGVPVDCEKLMPMPNQGGIGTSMWYI